MSVLCLSSQQDDRGRGRKSPPSTSRAWRPVGQEMTGMNASAVNRSRPIRRTRDEMQALREAMYEVLASIQPATVRQTFYQLVSRGVIAKTEHEYKHTVVRLLGEMRRAKEIPFDWIADNT